MKRTGLVLGLKALGLLGLALTQGMMGGYGPGYGMMGPGMMGMGMGGEQPQRVASRAGELRGEVRAAGRQG